MMREFIPSEFYMKENLFLKLNITSSNILQELLVDMFLVEGERSTVEGLFVVNIRADIDGTLVVH